MLYAVVNDTVTIGESFSPSIQSLCGCVAEIDAWVATIEARLTAIDAAFAANLAAINAYANNTGQVHLLEDETPQIRKG
jgi:hypothetical protein